MSISPNGSYAEQKLQVDEIIWLSQFVEKLAQKHNVTTKEVEEVFANQPHFRFVNKGYRDGEDIYSAMDKFEIQRWVFGISLQQFKTFVRLSLDLSWQVLIARPKFPTCFIDQYTYLSVNLQASRCEVSQVFRLSHPLLTAYPMLSNLLPKTS